MSAGVFQGRVWFWFLDEVVRPKTLAGGVLLFLRLFRMMDYFLALRDDLLFLAFSYVNEHGGNVINWLEII